MQRFTASDSDLGVNAALEYSLVQTEPDGDSEVRWQGGGAGHGVSVIS